MSGKGSQSQRRDQIKHKSSHGSQGNEFNDAVNDAARYYGLNQQQKNILKNRLHKEAGEQRKRGYPMNFTALKDAAHRIAYDLKN